jgi:hypothetical protein
VETVLENFTPRVVTLFCSPGIMSSTPGKASSIRTNTMLGLCLFSLTWNSSLLVEPHQSSWR